MSDLVVITAVDNDVYVLAKWNQSFHIDFFCQERRQEETVCVFLNTVLYEEADTTK